MIWQRAAIILVYCIRWIICWLMTTEHKYPCVFCVSDKVLRVKLFTLFNYRCVCISFFFYIRTTNFAPLSVISYDSMCVCMSVFACCALKFQIQNVKLNASLSIWTSIVLLTMLKWPRAYLKLAFAKQRNHTH